MTCPETKHRSKEPLTAGIPTTYGTQENTEWAMFILAFNNRVLNRSAIRIKKNLGITLYLNTIHVRYLLIVTFNSSTTKNSRTTYKAIQQGDYPHKPKERYQFIQELAETGLVNRTTETIRGKECVFYGPSELGYVAIDIIRDILFETYHTHPNNMSHNERIHNKRHKTGIRGK